MLAMALLLYGGLLGGMGGEAGGADGSGEGAWTLATPLEGFLVASGTGELAHLLHLRLFRAFPRRLARRLLPRTAPPTDKYSILTVHGRGRAGREAEGRRGQVRPTR